MIRKDYTVRVVIRPPEDPSLMPMEHTAESAATLLRGIPAQRRPLLRFTFSVVPQDEEAHELEIWSEDLGDAADRAFALAAMAYGPDTTVSLVSDRVPQPLS